MHCVRAAGLKPVGLLILFMCVFRRIFDKKLALSTGTVWSEEVW